MKYFIAGIAMLISIGWNLLQANNTSTEEAHAQIQIHGKVKGLQGNMVLNINDKYLPLSDFDRFTFQVYKKPQEQLTMHIVEKPENQHCEIVKSATTHNRMLLDIHCKKITQPISDNTVVIL